VENYRDEVYSERVRAGKRTYFFDVKPTRSEKDFFITITESKRVNDGDYKKHKIYLYKEDFEKFVDALNRSVSKAQESIDKVDVGVSRKAIDATVGEPFSGNSEEDGFLLDDFGNDDIEAEEPKL